MKHVYFEKHVIHIPDLYWVLVLGMVLIYAYWVHKTCTNIFPQFLTYHKGTQNVPSRTSAKIVFSFYIEVKFVSLEIFFFFFSCAWYDFKTKLWFVNSLI